MTLRLKKLRPFWMILSMLGFVINRMWMAYTEYQAEIQKSKLDGSEVATYTFHDGTGRPMRPSWSTPIEESVSHFRPTVRS